MVNRCDSVDALRYAYYEMIRIKEENQMLKKNKDYVEFTLQYTSVDWARSKDCPEVYLKGYSDFSFPGVPIMDVVCNEFDHKVVVVSKRDFDRLQADDQHYRELAKQREENYKALLDKTGFYNLADLMCYLPKDKTLKDIIDGLAAENEGLIKKLQESDPFAEKKEFLEKLYSKEDVEKLEWTLNHICGGKASANGWMVTAKLWRRNYETLSKLIGFSSVEEIQDYLTNEAECDTIHAAISKLHDQVKYTCDEWYSANSRNNSWKAAAECNSPKELIEKLNLLRDDISGRSTVIESYKRDIEKWQKATGCISPKDISTESLIAKAAQLDQEVKILNVALREWREGTGCPGPIAAKALIESGMAYEHGYHEVQEENRKLTEEIDSWKNVTGYSTPEDYMHVRINNATPFDYTAAWQDATGCVTPDQVKSRIEGLENAIRQTNRNMIKEIESNVDEWQKVTGFNEPKDFLKWKANIEGILEAWKSGTGCKYPAEARILLEKWKTMTKCETPEAAATWIASYESACERGNKLSRDIEDWRGVTGFNTPSIAKADRDRLIQKIKDMEEEVNELRADYSHLLLTTGFESEGEIEDALDKCDHSTLRKALVDYEFDYEALLKFTGYKSEHDIRVMLNGEKYQYKTMRELINSLERKVKFTESNWQKATGCDTPGVAEERIKYYKSRLGNAVQAASCATKHLENITF